MFASHESSTESKFALPIFFAFLFAEKNDVFAQGTLEELLSLAKKKSDKQSTNGTLCWLLTVGFFSLAKTQQRQYSGETKLNQHWLITTLWHFGAIGKENF